MPALWLVVVMESGKAGEVSESAEQHCWEERYAHSLCTESVCQSDLNLLCGLGSAAGGCQMKYEGMCVTFRGQGRTSPSGTWSQSLLPLLGSF